MCLPPLWSVRLSKRAEHSLIDLRLNSVIRPCILIRFKLCCWTVSLFPSSWFSFAWAVEALMFLYCTDLKGKVNCNALFYQPYQITPVKQLVKIEMRRHTTIGLSLMEETNSDLFSSLQCSVLSLFCSLSLCKLLFHLSCQCTIERNHINSDMGVFVF